jgi:hypothetical protein
MVHFLKLSKLFTCLLSSCDEISHGQIILKLYTMYSKVMLARAYSVTLVILSSSVSVHYLGKSQIWHMDTSKEYAGQVWISSWSDYLWQSYAPWRNFQFPFIIFATVVYIQLKFAIWIPKRNAQVMFKFGHGSMIFDSNAPLTSKIKKKFSSFCLLSP